MPLTAEEQERLAALAEKARQYNEQQRAALLSKREQRERDKQAYINASQGRAKASALLVWGRRGR